MDTKLALHIVMLNHKADSKIIKRHSADLDKKRVFQRSTTMVMMMESHLVITVGLRYRSKNKQS
jgi:hypothetical protein